MWSGIGKSVLVLGVLAGGCGGAGRPAAPKPAPAVDLAQSAAVSAGDHIDGLDVALDVRGGVHAVWRHTKARGVSSRGRIVYRHGTGVPLRWSAPVVIPGEAFGAPQVVAEGDGAHVFAGPRLHHWHLAASGRVEDRGDLLAGTAPRAEAFDAVAVGDAVSIVFRTSPLRRGAGLYSLRRTRSGATPPMRIAQAPTAHSPGRAAPKLHRVAGRLLAVWTQTRSSGTFDAASGVTSFQPHDEVFAAWSTDGGVRWSAASRIASVPGSDVAAIAVTDAVEGPVVFHAAHGLFSRRWRRTGWSPAMQHADHSAPSAPGATDITAIAATACGTAPALAWVDARHRRTDRRWWNPLGGVPWSDNPDWANNDVFVSRHALAPDQSRWPPQRLTADGTYTGDVAMVERGGELVVLHSGVAHVGKSRHDAGAAPHVLQSTVSCR